jgi:retinol dehydrogenase 12
MNRLAVVTGSNRGLGRTTAEKLARRGYRVVLTARHLAEGERAAAEIGSAAPGTHVDAMVLDLSSFASVRAFAADFRARFDTLDVLICNAGVMQQATERTLSADGHEMTFATNHLGHFLLTSLLSDLLIKSRARVVVVSSRLHLPDSRGAPVHFDFDDVDLAHGYNPERAYKNSKLCNLWFAYELQRRLASTGVVVNAVCPGFVPHTAAESTHGVMKLVMKHIMPHMPFAHSVDEATDTFVKVATDDSISGGGFWGEGQPIESSPESHDADKAARLWTLSEALTAASAR